MTVGAMRNRPTTFARAYASSIGCGGLSNSKSALANSRSLRPKPLPGRLGDASDRRRGTADYLRSCWPAPFPLTFVDMLASRWNRTRAFAGSVELVAPIAW